MTTTTRTAALGALAALMLAFGSPQDAVAHGNSGEEQFVLDWYTHPPTAPVFKVRRDPASPHDAIVVSWNASHYHSNHYGRGPQGKGDWIFSAVRLLDYRLYVRAAEEHLAGECAVVSPWEHKPEGCTRRVISLAGPSYSETFSGLTPGKTYYVWLAATWYGEAYNTYDTGVRDNGRVYTSPRNLQSSRKAITTRSRPATETPLPAHSHDYAAADHTHEPEAQTCTYEHRLIGVPGGAAYSGRILISSKAPNATATIRAYQSDNGHRIDVLDADGRDVETVSLDPANSVKRFTIEAAQGWHPVTVTHPSESAMQAATVAMRFRDGGSLKDSYPPGIEHCEPTSTGPVTTTDTPTEPETPSPPEPETPAPPEPETPDPVTPEPEPETPEPPAPAAAELAVTLTGAVRDAGKVAVSGTVTNAGTTASAPTRIRFLNGRRRVHTATVPAIGGGGVHAIRADVAMPDGDAVQVCIVPKGRDADPSNDCDTASVTTGQ